MVRSVGFGIVAVIAPALGIVIALPLALGPLSGDPRGVFGPYFLTALPIYLAMLAAPGYLACAFNEVGARASSPMRRWWIRASLGLAVVASLAGIWGASRMFLFGPPALVTLICASFLWTRFERIQMGSQSSD